MMLQRRPSKRTLKRQLGRRHRDRAYRQRLNAGEFVVPVVVNPTRADLLIRLRQITEADLLDLAKVARTKVARAKIGDAIGDLLDDAGA